MTKVRVVYKPDGRVSVIHLVEKARRPNESDEQMFNRIQAKMPELKDLVYDDIDINKLPGDRTERDKWRGVKGKGIWIDKSVKTEAEKKQEEWQAAKTVEQKLGLIARDLGWTKA